MTTPAPDLSEFEALSKRGPNQCVIGRSRESMDAQARANFDAALARKGEDGEYVFDHATITRWLKKQGLGGSAHSVRHHRAGECCCA